MRIGIFGGTFDPPHVGHLLAATDATEALALDRLLFVPAAQQPLKLGTSSAPARERLAMVRLLAGVDPRWVVDETEIERGGLSYTVDTLRELRKRWHDDRALELFLLLGADAAATLPQWRECAEVAALANVVVLSRGEAQERDAIGDSAGRVIAARRVDVSSTEIRDRVRAEKSIRGFVPDAIAEYIARGRLYR